MRNALSLVLGAFTLSMLAACGDASDSAGNQRSPLIPNDPSELPGAKQDPDSAPNPNASTPPPAPTTENTASTDVALSLDTSTPATDLGTKLDINVTVTPKGTATGTATLSVTGLPPGVTAAFTPASVTLGSAPSTAKMTLTVPYTAVPSAKDTPAALVVTATTGTGEAKANANFKVNPQVTLTVPVNAAALIAAGGTANVDGWGGPTFGTSPVALKTQAGNGINVIVKNADSAPHEVHGNGGANGFAHGSAAIPAGGTDTKVRVLDPAAGDINGSGYIHGEAGGTAVGFVFKVTTAQ